MIDLLDVNLLLALAWPNHVHHADALGWFKDRSAHAWATTPLTQLAFVRISANPAAIPAAVAPVEALAVLRQICELAGHTFLPDDLDLAKDRDDMDRVVAYRQVTDAHLLAVARRWDGRVATFDRGLPGLSGTPDAVLLVPFKRTAEPRRHPPP